MDTEIGNKADPRDIRPNVVSFVDILGYKRIVEDGQRSTRLFNAIADTVDNAHKRVKTLPPILVNPASISYRAFSDNIVVSCGYNPEPKNKAECSWNAQAITLVLLIQAELQMKLLTEYSFLATGGVAFGDYFRNDRFVFGKGLVNAYELQKKAGVPRILVADDVITKYIEWARKAGYHVTEENLGHMFIEDEDGKTYIHYLYAGESFDNMMSDQRFGSTEFTKDSRALLDKHGSSLIKAIEENLGDI